MYNVTFKRLADLICEHQGRSVGSTSALFYAYCLRHSHDNITVAFSYPRQFAGPGYKKLLALSPCPPTEKKHAQYSARNEIHRCHCQPAKQINSNRKITVCVWADRGLKPEAETEHGPNSAEKIFDVAHALSIFLLCRQNHAADALSVVRPACSVERAALRQLGGNCLQRPAVRAQLAHQVKHFLLVCVRQ